MRADGIEPPSLEWHSKAQPIDEARIEMAKVEGIEPSYAVLETAVLPLNYTDMITVRRAQLRKALWQLTLDPEGYSQSIP